MDDTLDSVSTVSDGVQLYKDLLALWSGAGMTARKWLSNLPEVLEAILVESRAKEINLQTHEFPAVKALGLLRKADKRLLQLPAKPRHQQDHDKPASTAGREPSL